MAWATGGASICCAQPDWQRYAWLRHGFSTRAGGVSTIYDSGAGVGSLNLGWTQQDDPANVAENRKRFLAAVAGKAEQAAGGTTQAGTTSRSRPAVPYLVTLRQFHSGMIRVVEAEDRAQPARMQTADGRAVLRGDG